MDQFLGKGLDIATILSMLGLSLKCNQPTRDSIVLEEETTCYCSTTFIPVSQSDGSARGAAFTLHTQRSSKKKKKKKKTSHPVQEQKRNHTFWMGTQLHATFNGGEEVFTRVHVPSRVCVHLHRLVRRAVCDWGVSHTHTHLMKSYVKLQSTSLSEGFPCV